MSSKQNNSDQSWLSLEQCNIQRILMKLVLLHILVNLRHLKISILFFKLSSLDLTIYQTNDKMILEITYKFLFWMIKYLKFEINIMAILTKRKHRFQKYQIKISVNGLVIWRHFILNVFKVVIFGLSGFFFLVGEVRNFNSNKFYIMTTNHCCTYYEFKNRVMSVSCV